VRIFKLRHYQKPGHSANSQAFSDLEQYPQGDLNPLHPPRKGRTGKEVTETTPDPLAQTLAREIEKDPDLARLIDAWPELPPAFRAGILAMVESVKSAR
jgi:hypothetical protein